MWTVVEHTTRGTCKRGRTWRHRQNMWTGVKHDNRCIPVERGRMSQQGQGMWSQNTYETEVEHAGKARICKHVDIWTEVEHLDRGRHYRRRWKICTGVETIGGTFGQRQKMQSGEKHVDSSGTCSQEMSNKTILKHFTRSLLFRTCVVISGSLFWVYVALRETFFDLFKLNGSVLLLTRISPRSQRRTGNWKTRT